MDTQIKLKEWLSKMGYSKTIPKNLINICNPSTSLIWEQLISKIVPLQEAQHIKNNIIINILQENGLQLENNAFPIEEISLYRDRKELETRKKIMESNLDEKYVKINKLCKTNKINQLLIEKTEKKIKQNEEKQFLLKKKIDLLSYEIGDATNSFSHLKRLTPVEMEDNPNQEEVTATLQKCAEKLESLLAQKKTSKKYNLNNITSLHPLNSIKKCNSTLKPSAYTLFNNSCTKSTNHKQKPFTSCRNIFSSIQKENLLNPLKGNCIKSVKKNLFANENFERKQIRNIDEIIQEKKKKSENRESLGILPDACFDNENLMLVDVDEEVDIKTQFLFEEIEQKSPLSVPKILVEECTSRLNSHLHLETRSNWLNSQTIRNRPQFEFNSVSEDENVKQLLNEILCSHNRYFVWNCLKCDYDGLIENLKELVIESKINESDTKYSNDYATNLYFIHIQMEIKAMKHKSNARKLNKIIESKKQDIFDEISAIGITSDRIQKQQQKLESVLNDIGLEAALSVIKEELNNYKHCNDNELISTLHKISRTRENIGHKITAIEDVSENTARVIESLQITKAETNCCIKKLNHFFIDLSWADPLKDTLISDEVKLFKYFPLEYNRKCINSDTKTYYRNITTSIIPKESDIDPNEIYTIASFIESPLDPPETVLLNILKQKKLLEKLKTLPDIPKLKILQKYTLKDLQEQENYLNYALDKLVTLKEMASNSKVSNSVNTVKKVLKLWKEMPFADLISSDRLLEDKPISYYQNKYDSILNSI